jgi:hypothetical protein
MLPQGGQEERTIFRALKVPSLTTLDLAALAMVDSVLTMTYGRLTTGWVVFSRRTSGVFPASDTANLPTK